MIDGSPEALIEPKSSFLCFLNQIWEKNLKSWFQEVSENKISHFGSRLEDRLKIWLHKHSAEAKRI